MIGLRNMLCGMHVHVEVPDPSTPHRSDHAADVLSAACCSRSRPLRRSGKAISPASPATGSPPMTSCLAPGCPSCFAPIEDYDEYVAGAGRRQDHPRRSYIWWAIRPSLRYPTIELRVADSCTRLDDALAIAALFRCLVRALDRDRALNAGFDRVGRAITAENKWHAQRHGMRRDLHRSVAPHRHHAPVDWLAEIRDIDSPTTRRRSAATAEIAHLGPNRRERHQRRPAGRDLSARPLDARRQGLTRRSRRWSTGSAKETQAF